MKRAKEQTRKQNKKKDRQRDCLVAKLSQSSTSTKLGWSLVLFLNNPTTPPPRNSKDYTFQEAEIWHASSNGPNKMKYEVTTILL